MAAAAVIGNTPEERDRGSLDAATWTADEQWQSRGPRQPQAAPSELTGRLLRRLARSTTVLGINQEEKPNV